MATSTLTASNFEQTVADNGIVLVDFWAEWCAPCRMFGPIFEASSEANQDIVHGKVDADAEAELFAATGSQAIPTLVAFRDGICVFSQAGALPAPALSQLIEQIRALDMDDVRRQLAEAKGAEVN